jgi:hypothetical protein
VKSTSYHHNNTPQQLVYISALPSTQQSWYSSRGPANNHSLQYSMIVISESLTTGQITFILRAVIQALSYGGFFILGIIILGSVPATAPVTTHDILNRIVGQSSATTSTMRWTFARLRGKKRDPVPSYCLLLALLLYLSYALFVGVSDIGFIGFHACEVAGANSLDFPASVKSDDNARNLVVSNLFSGTDPASVRAYRCNAAEPHSFNVDITLLNCTSWQNSTYADPNEFQNLNSTDSDVLMPLQLSHYNYARSNLLDLNAYYSGFGPQRLSRPVIARGLAIAPHGTGLRVVVGVPILSLHQQVAMPKALALEVEVGCMALGITGIEDAREDVPSNSTKDVFAMGDTWRDYTGPDYLSGILSETVDVVRAGLLPLFNASNKNADGDLISYNSSTFVPFNWLATINPYTLGEGLFDGTPFATIVIQDNCTRKLNAQLGLPSSKNLTRPASCALMQIGGSIIQNGTVKAVKAGMVCASTTQVNMVSATVAVDAAGNVTVDLMRLPSNLQIIEADYWDAFPDPQAPNTTTLQANGVVRRYTLSDNTTGPSSHFLFQEEHAGGSLDFLFKGVGSGVGYVFSEVGAAMWEVDIGGPLTFLGEENYLAANLNTSKVTEWAGELAGSYIQAALGYNGWAARNGEPLLVVSTGGQIASCFDARYGAAFMPLFVAALVVIIWGIVVVLMATIAYIQHLKTAYGGLAPYTSSVFPDKLHQETVLAWKNDPCTHLEVVSRDADGKF